MRVKTFRGSSTAAVFAEIKAEFGDNAVILSNKTTEELGRKIHEIMVGVDNQKETASIPETREDVIGDAMNSIPDWNQEWNQIKGHMMALLKPQMNMNLLAPRQRLALEYLEREGVESNVILDLFQQLRGDKSKAILPELEKIAPVRPFEKDIWKEKFHAMSGPHGAGKTSTIIRLALKEKKENPTTRICLVSADQGQGKGRLVLRHYADLSGIEFKEIASREDFARLIGECHNFDRIFLDLPGMSANAELEGWMAACGMHGPCDIAVHLVLNPYYAPAQYNAFLKKYKSPKLKSLIWTKLDESCNYGALVNTAYESGLPVSLLSYGSGLRNTMKPATERDFWRLIFKHQLPAKDKVEFAKAI
ncbi:flagellar biosynthesis protein FlhF [Maridesulfovibrio hydrothermalis]|uniref:Putative Flagellar biosynthesis protein FlhF n=1 Tax=Maridesulfovibrio hydrothermalis AM13 = DSM 14728 TaxID=1121451 RepID=L0RHC1_9BACT|nr:flagellar biosynthesis protein FlhF [Maridesulfovibrio hydrothermalis]CCO24956.1 putative Flagellar biosynthesis protein FlhF [Maridesulfovibrio hydrothermalis AM13 = DSM 14728]